MRLYLGSREYCPEGYLTVDINPRYEPDILSDVTALTTIADGSIEEICASHILEHLPWPKSVAAIAEWSRVLKTGGVLKIGVPDIGVLSTLLANGQNPWGAMGLIYGLGRLTNPLEAHQFGYTRAMLVSILQTLGFGNMGWWKHDLPDASNGWTEDGNGGRVAISLNISAEKRSGPIVPLEKLTAALTAQPGTPFDSLVVRLLGETPTETSLVTEDSPLLTQKLHFALIEARMRIVYLEKLIEQERSAAGEGK